MPRDDVDREARLLNSLATYYSEIAMPADAVAALTRPIKVPRGRPGPVRLREAFRLERRRSAKLLELLAR
jgi:hypothetical protein